MAIQSGLKFSKEICLYLYNLSYSPQRLHIVHRETYLCWGLQKFMFKNNLWTSALFSHFFKCTPLLKERQTIIIKCFLKILYSKYYQVDTVLNYNYQNNYLTKDIIVLKNSSLVYSVTLDRKVVSLQFETNELHAHTLLLYNQNGTSASSLSIIMALAQFNTRCLQKLTKLTIIYVHYVITHAQVLLVSWRKVSNSLIHKQL